MHLRELYLNRRRFQPSNGGTAEIGRVLALPPDREAVSVRSPESFRGRGMSKSIPPCLCIGTRCESRRPRGPFPLQGAQRWWRYQDAPH